VLSRTQVQRNPLRALAAPHPGRPPGWLTRASNPAGVGLWHPIDPPRGLPHGAPGASMASSGRRWAGCCRPGHRVVGLTADGMTTQPQHARSVIAAERLVEKHLTENQMFGGRHTAGQSPRPKSLPIYISWYINDYGRPWTSSDPNPTMRPDHGQIAGSCGVLPVTTDQMTDRYVFSVGRVHTVAPAARAPIDARKSSFAHPSSSTRTR
jgi:hypothetical protein